MRFPLKEHDEIEKIEKGKRAFWNAFVMLGKKPIRCEIGTLQSGLCISTRLADAGPLVIRTGIS